MTNKLNKVTNIDKSDEVKASEVFNIDTDLIVSKFIERSSYVPEIDDSYVFDQQTTIAILLGLKFNKRVFIQGLHGTGKSTHIEQVCARLNWPCVRINLDSHISRIDLIGKDSIVLKEGKQVTEFQEGILPWAFQNNVALVFDEYDAGRPDVMFVIQRILETEGKLTLLDQNKVLKPHPYFRIFATANTVGLGDTSGIYHGTNQINQGQMDRWSIISKLNYLSEETEIEIVSKKIKANDDEKKYIKSMVKLANLTRKGFQLKDISTLMSPRTVIMLAENYKIIKDMKIAFELTFLNKCDESEIDIYKEYFQRSFGFDI
ncbi:AAA family ATPase [Alphaproteobacteria bacterium]|jgi:cobaltochelatase CobS|nr:AAA family ATPase [Alphaproteobacteria bacterium]MDB4183922.1 AAA family ATPase [Alphaproteobacteria bacterium]MDB9825194.1 AAA family ATPase [Alphaproteobacteria bacterium]|tara:strand:+ start:419 stop:1372 length:954 start_codon:yes stop_codon:yes gene_type:complete